MSQPHLWWEDWMSGDPPLIHRDGPEQQCICCCYFGYFCMWYSKNRGYILSKNILLFLS